MGGSNFSRRQHTCTHTTTNTYTGTVTGYCCNAGDSLSGSTCTHTTTSTYAGTVTGYSCNSGDSLSGSTCTHTTTNTYGGTPTGYSCNAGDSLSGSTCTHTASSAYTASVSGYSCNPGDSLSGSTCTYTSTASPTANYSCSSGTLSGNQCLGARRRTAYVYLGGKEIAETSEGTTQYVHTDALGSPVAHTSGSGGLLNRSRFEPYGYVAQGTKPSAGTSVVGFTGHVQDAETDLVYMQQRYYDPIAGRFLSVDPVTTDTETGREFGRYTYVDNNPYAKVDPDGRIGVAGFLVGASIDVGVQVISGMASGQSFGRALSNVNGWQVLASGALGAVGQIGGASAARAAVSGLSRGAKGALGEAVARVGIAARGEKVIASQTAAGKVPELGNITGRAAKAVPDFVTKTADGTVKVVEAKFGTSGLTGAQQALKSQMGEAFTVSRTTANEVANVGGHAGAVVGGSTAATIGQKIKE